MMYNNDLSIFGCDTTTSILSEYTTSDAAINIITESFKNDMEIFNKSIVIDFNECAVKHNSNLLSESDITSIQENFITDAWHKVIALLKSIKDKIVSVLESFINKIKMMCTKDSKELLKKYSRQFYSNSAKNVTVKNWKNLRNINPTNLNVFESEFAKISDLKSTDELEKWKRENTTGKIFAKVLKSNGAEYTSTEFRSEFMKKVFDDPSTKDGFSESEKSEIASTLDTGKDQINALQNLVKEHKSTIDRLSNTAKSMQSEANRIDINDAANKSLQTVKAHSALTFCNAYQSIVGVISSCMMDALKTNISQARRAFIAIATYRNSNESVYTDSEFQSIVEDVCEYDTESIFDDYEEFYA